MDRNQISYWQLQEAKRSNLAQEANARAQLEELRRANLAKEAETQRSNLVSESNQMYGLSETARTHRANESLQYGSLIETVRSNKAREAEQYRSHAAGEALTASHNLLQSRYNIGTLANERRKTEISASESTSRKFSNYTGGISDLARPVVDILTRRKTNVGKK